MINITPTEKFAKLFEVNGYQILVTKDLIDTADSGESDPGINFRSTSNGHTIIESLAFDTDKLRDEAFDKVDEDVANSFRLEAIETFKELLGDNNE